MPRNHYIVLGIDRGADQKQIKKAYRRIAKKYHPDAGCSEASSKKFIELREAYETLSDEQKRKAYDRELNRKRGPVRISSPPDATRRPTGSFHRPERFFAAVDEFFNGFFTDFEQWRGLSRPGADIYLEAILTPAEARQGGVFPLTIPVQVACPRCSPAGAWERLFCPLCAGTGQVRTEKQFSLRIPPGVQNGALIQLTIDDRGAGAGQVQIVVRIESGR